VTPSGTKGEPLSCRLPLRRPSCTPTQRDSGRSSCSLSLSRLYTGDCVWERKNRRGRWGEARHRGARRRLPAGLRPVAVSSARNRAATGMGQRGSERDRGEG
jgi:hypothetical protein